MIDLHSHLLPGIDDGPETLEEALDLARAVVADGITTSVLTPHIHPGRYENRRSGIQQAVERFQLALAQANIPLKVLPGAEVRVSLESLDLLREDEIPFLGEVKGVRIMLLEFPHSHVPVGSLQMVEKLLERNIRPLIAHPERNKGIMDDPRRLDPYLAVGCWLQLTAASVAGDFGRQAQQVAWRLLDDDAVRVVATDAHNLSGRSPRMSAAREVIERQWGSELAEDLFIEHPLQMIARQLAKQATTGKAAG